MFKVNRSTLIAAAISTLISSPTFALDARTAALGGSAIANATGAYGALENPSSLMRMQRDGQVFHFHLGASTDIQDDGGYIASAIDEATLPQEIEDEIDALSGRTLTCNESSTLETVCLVDTSQLATLSARVLDILEAVDQQSLAATASADLGFAYTKWSIPIAIHYKATATGAAKTIVASGDKDYIGAFVSVLADNELTVEELLSSVPLDLSEDGQSLSIQKPEDALQSDVEGSGLTREQLGLSMATSVELAGISLDLGITPKFSELKAASLITELNDRFNDSSDTFEDQFNANETVATSWNIDVGASATLQNAPITVSVVARNLVNESITTKENFVFETTPQLIVGGAYKLDSLIISADMALNEAKIDNMETQILAVGVELSRSLVGLRVGMSHDTARTNDATALSLGFSIGPLHIGGRLTDQASAQAGAQLAFSF